MFGWDWNSNSLHVLKLMLVLDFPWQIYLDNSSYVLHADDTVVRYKALVRLQTSESPFLQESELNATSIHLPDWYALLKIKNTKHSSNFERKEVLRARN